MSAMLCQTESAQRRSKPEVHVKFLVSEWRNELYNLPLAQDEVSEEVLERSSTFFDCFSRRRDQSSVY
jgi:hypothetical protein